LIFVSCCAGPDEHVLWLRGSRRHPSSLNVGLDDVDESTFLAFIRWTYTKDHPAQEHTTIEPEEAAAPEVDFPAPDDDWGWGKPKKGKKKKTKPTEPAVQGFLRESFISQQRDPDLAPASIPSARANKGPEEDYTEVLLGHARMYVFAEKYDIQDLKKLALQKLQHQLAIHTLYVERCGEILALLRYVYANTREEEGEEGVRGMLAHYVGVEMGMLVKDGEIKEFMLEEGECLGDFLRMFAARVN